jgi:hypothetical protein
LAVVLAVGVLVVVAGAQARGTANSVTFPDSDTAAENPANADITSVVVSNDDAANLTFRVNVGNQPQLTSSFGVRIFLDTDKNLGTGFAEYGIGVDAFIQVSASNPGVFVWNGSSFDRKTLPSFSASYAAGSATFRVAASDLGNPKSISFVAQTLIGTYPNIVFDYAPDNSANGGYSYDIKIAPVLTAGPLRETPRPAKAGKPFVLSLPATESDTDRPITTGRVLCAATISGKPLAAKSKGIARGAAICRFKIPANAKGKTIRGTITVVVQGTRLKKTFSAHIR